MTLQNLEDVLKSSTDWIENAKSVSDTESFCEHLESEKPHLEALVAQHVGLDAKLCVIQPLRQWIKGSFNVCIPVVLNMVEPRMLLLRIAQPHKVVSMDEKINSEVATYAWLQIYCPNIPIPQLYGFGFSDNRHFSHTRQCSRYAQLAHFCRRLMYAKCGSLFVSHYTKASITTNMSIGYVLQEYIPSTTGKMLSCTWDSQRHDAVKRRNLFGDMARILLSMARISHPSIGSLRFHDDGAVSLTNRALCCSTAILENAGADGCVEQYQTHRTVDSYIGDLFTLHDRSLIRIRNAVCDEEDCRSRMAVRTAMRSVAHHYLSRDFRDGPFVLQFTDFHASNIFVDDEWNITCLIDLEWVIAGPIEMLRVPSWLSGKQLAQIKDNFEEFDEVRKEFMDSIESQERELDLQHSISGIMNSAWQRGSYWFYSGLSSVNAMYTVFYQYIAPQFSTPTNAEEHFLSRYWSMESEKVVETKLQDRASYVSDLKVTFNSY